MNISIGETPYDSPSWDIDSNPSHRNRLEGFLAPSRPVSVSPSELFDVQLHNQVHVWIGGDQLNVNVSPNDPVFFLHHANVDRLWAIWQEKNPSQGYVPTGEEPNGHNLYDLMYPWDGKTTKLKARPAEVLDSRQLGIYYA